MIVLSLIFIGARVGGIGLGIYGMVGVFILVFIFGMRPGNIPIDVMLIIASVITATAALQAAGGLDYMVEKASKFLRKHPEQITYLGPLVTWLFTMLAGTAHTSYSLLPIIVAAFVQNRVGKELEDDPEYQRRVREGLIQPVDEVQTQPQTTLNPRAKWSVLAFLLGVVLVVLFGSVPALRPSFEVDGVMKPLSMPQTIEIVMMSIAALILLVGKADVKAAVNGNIFSAGMNAMIAIFGIAWMGDTFFNGNLEFFKSRIAGIVTALNPYIGYKTSTKVAKEALDTNRSVYDIVLEKGLMTQEKLDEALDPKNMLCSHR